MNLRDISAHWVALHEALGVGTELSDDVAYQSALDTVGQLMEAPGGIDGSPLAGLAALLADRIVAYEARHHPWPETATPAQVISLLMDQHGLRQSELPEIGSQGVVSEVLAGKRALNLRQVKALARRFAVPMEALAG